MDNEHISKYKNVEIPVWKKTLLTLNEASAYTGLGINRLRTIANSHQNELVVWVGSKRMFKRRKLDEYLEKAISL